MSHLSDAICKKLDSIECDLCSKTLSPDEAQPILSRLEVLRVSIIQQCPIEEIAVNIMVNDNE